MYLFKASASTYPRVLGQARHAFHAYPSQLMEDELVLLSKNRNRGRVTERQIQAIAKVLRVRPAYPTELEEWFPGVDAAQRWRYTVELYCVRPLSRPFNLTDAHGVDEKRYRTVQGFARLARPDATAVLHHLAATNEDVILDVVNNASRPAA
jgi:hypothetical protein